MTTTQKSSVEEIRRRFDADVERFSNLATGQVATIDALASLELVAQAARAATPGAAEVLDIGCGAGNYSLKLREHFPAARFTLVDLSQPMLDRAAERLGSSVRETVAGDIRELDFAPGRFDVIVAAAVFHHLRTPAEWERTFAACHRWLKPGGSLWIFDLVAHEDPAIQAMMWASYGRYLEDQGGAAYRDKVFAYVEREDTPVSLTRQLAGLAGAGFAAIDVLHKRACFAAFGGIKR